MSVLDGPNYDLSCNVPLTYNRYLFTAESNTMYLSPLNCVLKTLWCNATALTTHVSPSPFPALCDDSPQIVGYKQRLRRKSREEDVRTNIRRDKTGDCPRLCLTVINPPPIARGRTPSWRVVRPKYRGQAFLEMFPRKLRTSRDAACVSYLDRMYRRVPSADR